jgi:hypothetical protein
VDTAAVDELALLEYPPGWTCERTALQFEHYLLGTLVLNEALALAEHLGGLRRVPQRLVLSRLTLGAFPWLTGSLGERIAAEAERELATKAG